MTPGGRHCGVQEPILDLLAGAVPA